MYYINPYIKDLYRVKFHDDRTNVLRLDMNENPEGLPNEIFEKIAEKITPEYIATYPQKDCLMQAIAQHNQYSCENVSITAGSDEAMRLIFQCFGQAGRDLVTVTPTFEMYDVYAKMFGMNHVAVPYQNDFTVKSSDILDSISSQTGIVILLNPNSPIGAVFHEDEVQAVIRKAQSVGAVVVIDEAYHYFYAPTFMPLIKEYDNLLILRTFSKLFSMAGLRIGYVSGHPALIDYIEKAESTFNVNNIAILFALEVINNQELTEALIQKEKAGREWLSAQLKQAGYRYYALEGNYILLYPNKQSSEIVAALKEKNVWIRDYGRGILQGWLRVSTGSVSCMKIFWDEFSKIDSL